MNFFSFLSQCFFLMIWFFRQVFFVNKKSFFSSQRWKISLSALMTQKPFSLLQKNLLLQIFREKLEKSSSFRKEKEPIRGDFPLQGDFFLFSDRHLLHFLQIIYFFYLARRLNKGVPVALILGSTPFLEQNFFVRRGVFLPRIETEEMAQKIIRRHQSKKGLRILELGCGSGVICVSLFSYLDVFQMFAADINAKAIRLTQRNFQRLVPHFASLEQKRCFRLFRGSVFSLAFQKWLKNTRFDIIVSNPPYVGEKEREMVDVKTKQFDPSSALYAGADGLDFYKKVFPFLPLWLKDEGVFYGEIGFQQARAVMSLANEAFGQFFAQNPEKERHFRWHVNVEKDFFNQQRFLTVKVGKIRKR